MLTSPWVKTDALFLCPGFQLVARVPSTTDARFFTDFHTRHRHTGDNPVETSGALVGLVLYSRVASPCSRGQARPCERAEAMRLRRPSARSPDPGRSGRTG